MDSAELLIGQYGVEGVALRQILIHAKQTNKNAIAEYFGDRDDLVAAIVTRRIDELNARRRELIISAEARGRPDDVPTLLEIIYRPLAEVTDKTGRYTYARFLQQAQLYRPFGDQWPLGSGDVAVAPMQAVQRLHKLVPHLHRSLFYSRVDCLSGMFLSSLSTRERRISIGHPTVPFDEFFGDLLNMMSGALVAEVPTATNPSDSAGSVG